MSRARSLADGRLRLDFPTEQVARLTIANPAKRNALDHAILDGIARTVAALEGVRCLVLTHFSQRYEDPGAFGTEAARWFDGEVVVAADLLRVPVPRR